MLISYCSLSLVVLVLGMDIAVYPLSALGVLAYIGLSGWAYIGIQY